MLSLLLKCIYKKEIRAKKEEEFGKMLKKKQNKIWHLEEYIIKLEKKYFIQKSKIFRFKKMIRHLEFDCVLEKQLDIAQNRLLCDLCTSRMKSTIIMNCLHMFCFKCILDHFRSRNRKCPQCKQTFSKDDLKDV